MPNTLCDAVLICTVYYANFATASVIGCVILANFLKSLRLVEDPPVTCCAKHIKARSTLQLLILYLIRLEQSSSVLICCRGVK